MRVNPTPGRYGGSFPPWLFLITIVWNGAQFITNGAPGRYGGSFPPWLFLITIVWNGAQFITNGAGKQHILGGFIHVRRQNTDLP